MSKLYNGELAGAERTDVMDGCYGRMLWTEGGRTASKLYKVDGEQAGASRRPES